MQKAKIEKKDKRKRAALLETTTSASENEEPPTKRKPNKKKNLPRQAPEIAFDFEEETRPPLVEISSTSTEEGRDKEAEIKQETGTNTNKEIEQNPKITQAPTKATTNW